MRNLARPSRLDRLSREARVVYTGFCLFLLAGYGTSVWFYLDDDLGVTPAATEAYYLGSAPGAATSEALAGGPALDLPPPTTTEPAREMRFEKPPRQVMETFHFHLFSVPIVLLIIAHIFMMCRLRAGVKIGVIVGAHVGTFVHLAAPPLVRFASESFAFLMFPSAVVMTVTWVWMTAWPVYDMWWGASAHNGEPANGDLAHAHRPATLDVASE